MLEYLYSTQGLDPNMFRGFRLDVQYPIYAAEYMVGFRVPNAPASNQSTAAEG